MKMNIGNVGRKRFLKRSLFFMHTCFVPLFLFKRIKNVVFTDKI